MAITALVGEIIRIGATGHASARGCANMGGLGIANLVSVLESLQSVGQSRGRPTPAGVAVPTAEAG